MSITCPLHQNLGELCRVHCVTCPYVVTGSEVKCPITGKMVKLTAPVNCQTTNCVYAITCNKCHQKYIGTTGNSISSRFGQHRGYVNQYNTKIEAGKIPEATGEHFNLPSHSISDMELQIVEKVFSKSSAVREQREKMWINYFESETKGMNRRQ